VRATCPTYLINFDFITLIIFGEVCKLCSSKSKTHHLNTEFTDLQENKLTTRNRTFVEEVMVT